MPISYDGALNPLSYVINGSECTLTWTQGRRLASISGEEEGTDYTYTYNSDGIRTSKTVNGVEHIYHLSGTQILSEEWTENGVQHLIVYSYDASGYPISMTYRKSTDAATAAEVYFLATNLQGDVTYIYDIDGNRVVTYNYDAWGNILSITGTKATTIGRYNPFRYRGYYYDNETGFYYLNSRYYDPSSGRFLTADGQLNDGLLGYNLFAYCENNPVMGYDPIGEWNWGGVIAGLGIIAATIIVVATCGVGTGIGAVVAAAAITTGVTMTYAAATDSAMVMDVSISLQIGSDVYVKGGGSLVIDFSKDGGIYGYGHGGVGAGYSSGCSYSVGLVNNLNSPEDYSRHFLDVNAGSTLGIDHCFDPTKKYYEATRATSITFGNGFNYGIGYDYYSVPIVFTKWG